MPSVTTRYKICAGQKEGRVCFVNPIRLSEEVLMKQNLASSVMSAKTAESFLNCCLGRVVSFRDAGDKL